MKKSNDKQTQPPQDWLFVVRNPKHLLDLKKGDHTWWCVDRRCKPGDRAFIYRPLKGISMFLKIIDPAPPNSFCTSFSMNTAMVEIARVFDPPISARTLRSNLSDANFVRRNFQGTAFEIHSLAVTKSILSLA